MYLWQLGPKRAAPSSVRQRLPATETGCQRDVWGTAFAVWVGVLSGADREKTCRALLEAYRSGKAADRGYVRHILAGEVDDQILDLGIVDRYPLELYEKAEKRLHSSEVSIETVQTRIKNNLDTFTNIGYTHEHGIQLSLYFIQF